MQANLGLVIAVAILALGCSAQDNPVPIPPGGRKAVHGWSILPLDQEVDPKNPTVDAWLVHHVPEFYKGSPHDWEIIMRATITPLPHAGQIVDVIPLPYPPKAWSLLHEYTFTPPPAFSLNDLLSGDLKTLQGVVYNGSFDSTYERIPLAIARVDVKELTTTLWLNDSSAVLPYNRMMHFSYPRAPRFNGESKQPFYLVHELHKAPDYDQILYTVIDLNKCWVNDVKLSRDETFDYVSVPGLRWSFKDRRNTLEDRLEYVDAEIMITTSHQRIVKCEIVVWTELHCTVGPGFDERCPPK